MCPESSILSHSTKIINMNAIEFVGEMDRLAEVHFGEFGYATCSSDEQKVVIKLLLHNLKK
jgi:hypothetical protein